MTDQPNRSSANSSASERDVEAPAAGPTTKTAAKRRSATKPQSIDVLPEWRVLLHNDDVNYMEDVIDAIVELTPLSMDEAVERMLEAHLEGISLLLTTHRERAELYCEQFESKLLMVTIEPT